MMYLPFLAGKYSTAPGLTPISKVKDHLDSLIFQIDDTYPAYIQNKMECRKENMGKYYCEKRFWNTTLTRINQYLVDTLLREHPDKFKLRRTEGGFALLNLISGDLVEWDYAWKDVRHHKYGSLFDALCCQVQEDIAICQLDHGNDWLAALHLCAPNHWSAEEKIGHPFSIVHAPVPEMDKTKAQSYKLLQSVLHKGPFTRFAWGISTDSRLNHHSNPGPGLTEDEWHGRKPLTNGAGIYIRSERQNLVGFPEVQAFLFTIRTYFYTVDDLNAEEKNALLQAVETMSTDTINYKGLGSILPALKEKCSA